MIDKADLMTKAIQLKKELGEDSNPRRHFFSVAKHRETHTGLLSYGG